MKVLVVHPGPAFSVADVWQGWCRGLADAGCHVQGYALDDRLTLYTHAKMDIGGETRHLFDRDGAIALTNEALRAVVYDFWPDVIVVVSGFFLTRPTIDILRNRGHRLVLVCTESPYEDDRQLDLARRFDHVLLNDPANLARFQAETDAWYQPHCYDAALHYPADRSTVLPRYRSDVVFVGTGYPSRVAVLERVDWSGVDFALAGNWEQLPDGSPLQKHLAHDPHECSPNEETAELYRGTVCGLNLYRAASEGETGAAAGVAVGPREVELAACGRMFLREPRPEGDDLFPFLPRFSSPAELGDLARWWSARPDMADRLGARARARVEDRTFPQAARRLLERVTR